MKRIACTYHLSDKSVDFDSQGVAQYRDRGLRMALYGRLIVDGAENDFEAIRRQLDQDRALATQRYGGMYLLLTYDEADRTLRLFQDFFGAPIPVYYAQAGNQVYIDTSLKHLLARSGLRPIIDRSAAAQFMAHGAVFGKRTLLQGVYKLEMLHALEVHDAPRQYRVTYVAQDMTAEQAKARWEQAVGDSIVACARDERQVNMPLSSGYDSNFILYTLNKRTALPINAYSLGARRGVSELEVVKRNVTCYPRARLTTGYTDRDTLAHFDDIVWRLEGAVFEAGIFLQYELARLVSRDGGDFLVCGECADQVMNEDFAINQQHVPDPRRASISQDPYTYGSGIVVKKSGIMLNSFGVEGRYPYIDLQVAGLCRALAPVNKKGKLYHKSVCEKRLPARVLGHISKVGGSTCLHSLFEDQAHIDAFFAMVEQSPAFTLYRTEAPKGASGEGGGALAKVKRFVKSEPSLRLLIAKVLGKLRVTSADHYRSDFRRQERKLNDYMRLSYLATFERLFVAQFDPAYIGKERPARQAAAPDGRHAALPEKILPGKSCGA